MAKRAQKVQRAGAYVVKAAESRPQRVEGKTSSRTSTPTREDKSVASDLLKARGN